MTKLLKDVAVVIPVFNEEKLIGECINEWLNVLDSVNLNYEILIIDAVSYTHLTLPTM